MAATLIAVSSFSTAALAGGEMTGGDIQAQLEQMKAQIAELEAAQKKLEELKSQVSQLEAEQKNSDKALKDQITDVKVRHSGDNIKWSVDFRTAVDYVEHEQGSGMLPTGVYDMTSPATGYNMFAPAQGKDTDNTILTNKLILGMQAQPVTNLVFKGSLGVYTVFGESSFYRSSMFQDFDWYATSKPQDDAVVRLREAYFLYFGEMGESLPYTFSLGRRPSTDGFLVNYREDNAYPASPIGHNINMEFDGLSFKVDLEDVTDVSGLYAKLCLGRGFSNTLGAYSMSNQYNFNSAYASGSDNPDMDLAGLLMQLYDDGQYKVMANVFMAWNLMGMGMDITMSNPTGTSGTYTMTPNGFHDVGDMTGAALSLQVSGIGDGISDFLDDTIFFISGAANQTDPNNDAVNTLNGSTAAAEAMHFGGNGMLGSTDSEVGYSIYAGINMPGFFSQDRFGLEYNHGSEYWRSFTYGEDTLAGSKLATRGNAYEIYYSFPIVGKYLTGQIRYTYLDYDYAGSDTFFGQTGNPDGLLGVMPYVENAQSIRFYIRYRF